MSDAAVMVTVSGLLRGQDLAGDARATLDEEALRLDRAGGAVRLPFERLDGARYAVGTLELFMARGDVITLGGRRRWRRWRPISTGGRWPCPR